MKGFDPGGVWERKWKETSRDIFWHKTPKESGHSNKIGSVTGTVR